MNKPELISFLLCIWKELYAIINIVGNIAITMIGIYTAIRTFRHKVKLVSLGFSCSNWEGYSFNAVIQNWSLSALSIKKIELVYDKKQILLLKNFSDPLFVEPLMAVKIVSDKMKKNIYNNFQDFQKVRMYIFCVDGKIIKTALSRTKHQSFNEYKYERLKVLKEEIDGISINDTMKYIVYIYHNKKIERKIILNKFGMLNEEINGYNALPKDVMSDIKCIKQTLLSLYNDNSYEIILWDIEKNEEAK